MNARFADTSFYIAMVNERDAIQTRAIGLARSWRGQVVTTQFVLIELANWLSRTADREIFRVLLEDIEADPRTQIVQASDSWYREGLARYLSRPDKEWSLTDCISFVVMEQHQITEALTANHHFEQAGFLALLQ